VLGLSILSLSENFVLNFGAVPIDWYFFHFILLPSYFMKEIGSCIPSKLRIGISSTRVRYFASFILVSLRSIPDRTECLTLVENIHDLHCRLVSEPASLMFICSSFPITILFMINIVFIVNRWSGMHSLGKKRLSIFERNSIGIFRYYNIL
jgi:hypothetical protein